MKNILKTAIFAALVLMSGCATQSGSESASSASVSQSSLIPKTLSSDVQAAFREVASEISNPCFDETQEKYKTLEALLDAGKTCHEAFLLSYDLIFYLQNGVDKLQIQGMLRYQARFMATPAKFMLDKRPRLGSASAPVEIVLFSDFQCPFCARAAATIHRVFEAHPDDISVVFKQMPLTSIHPFAGAAAIISTYANGIGKFWETHDLLFSNQKAINGDMLTELAIALGTTPEDLFDPDKGKPYSIPVIEDIQDASTFGVEGTPSVFVNGIPIEHGANYDRLMARIDAELHAPAPTDEASREAAKQKALEHCPYPGHEELYALLTPAGRADLTMFADSVLCPCPDNSHTLHECAATCDSANAIIDTVISHIMEEAPQADILEELDRLVRNARNAK